MRELDSARMRDVQDRLDRMIRFVIDALRHVG